MTSVIDCHTHRTDASAALIAVDPRQFAPQPGLWYSVGYHPWYDVDNLNDADFDMLEQCAKHPQVLAIGETGMDSLRGADLDSQARIFVRHLQVAHVIGKPVVVHCVRTAQRIIDERRKARLTAVPLARRPHPAGCRLLPVLRHPFQPCHPTRHPTRPPAHRDRRGPRHHPRGCHRHRRCACHHR